MVAEPQMLHIPVILFFTTEVHKANHINSFVRFCGFCGSNHIVPKTLFFLSTFTRL